MNTLTSFQNLCLHSALQVMSKYLFNIQMNVTLYQKTNFYTGPNWSIIADDKISVIQKLKFDLGMVENIVGEKEKMLVTSIFSFSNNVFKSFHSLGR